MVKKNILLHKKRIYFGNIVVLVICIGIILILSISSKNKVVINGHDIFVEIANTPYELQRGLSGREVLCENCGMLFVFGTPGYYQFWMKDMYFDIDMIWINNNTVVHISDHVSHKTPEDIIVSPELADIVLEVSAGQSDVLDITVGQKVKCLQ